MCPMTVEYSDIELNKKKILFYIKEASNSGAQVICLPEYCTTGYSYDEDNYSASRGVNFLHDSFIETLKEESTNRKIDIIIGLLEKDTVDNEVKYFNSAIYIEDGKILLKHRKIQEGGPITPGQTVNTANTKLGKTSIIICGDLFNDFVLKKLQDLRPDIVLMPMDRCLGNMDFCKHYESSCDSKNIDCDDASTKCYEKGFKTHKEAWNKRSKQEYAEQVTIYKSKTIIVNMMSTDHKKSCGGALYISSDGKIINEIPYAQSEMKIIDI